MRFSLSFIALAILPCSIVNAESECIELYNKADYSEAFKKCSEEATNNNASPEIWFNLAHMYDNGDGTATDAAEAFVWYEKAAKGNYAPAQYNLAIAYHQGRGTATDENAAITWLTKASANGDIDAPEVLAAYYLKQKQYEQAVIWLITANRAKPNNNETEYDLAKLYLKGQGTEQNIKAGIKNMKLAAKHGNQAAMKKMGFLRYDSAYGIPDLEKAYFWWLLYTKVYPEDSQDVSESMNLAENNLSDEIKAKTAKDVEEWMKKNPIEKKQ